MSWPTAVKSTPTTATCSGTGTPSCRAAATTAMATSRCVIHLVAVPVATAGNDLFPGHFYYVRALAPATTRAGLIFLRPIPETIEE